MTEQHNLYYFTLFICGGPCQLFLLQKVLYACMCVCVSVRTRHRCNKLPQTRCTSLYRITMNIWTHVYQRWIYRIACPDSCKQRGDVIRTRIGLHICMSAVVLVSLPLYLSHNHYVIFVFKWTNINNLKDVSSQFLHSFRKCCPWVAGLVVVASRSSL